jgi:uncharacterized membrane protein
MDEHEHDHKNNAIEDTGRLEAFSDGVYAIVITLLVLELKVPVLDVLTTKSFLHGLAEIAPEFVAFVFSFFIVAIFWVNHHHFFHSVQKTDWKLLWYNNFHLFWITTIPFTTALIGRYHTELVPILVYGIDMVMAALSIMLMIKYVFFRSTLLYPGFSEERKRSEFKRGFWGVYLYLAAIAGAFIHVYIALAIFILTPICFVIPQVLSHEEV